MRSDEALKAALERERVVGDIARKVRSEIDLEKVLQIAVEEVAEAVGVLRCFIRLGELGEPMPILAGVGRAERRAHRRGVTASSRSSTSPRASAGRSRLATS